VDSYQQITIDEYQHHQPKKHISQSAYPFPITIPAANKAIYIKTQAAGASQQKSSQQKGALS
jgi:hypothetical protein